MRHGLDLASTAWRLIVAVAVLIPLSSCATLGPDDTTAGEVAVRFHQALTDEDGAAACGMLAPETVRELEQTADTVCNRAVLDADLPAAQTVGDSQAFGRGAQVVMDGDVVFLSLFDGRWQITAAGCQPRDDRPYDCTLKGG